MALVKCPECGRVVSDKALSCPECGYPVADSIREENERMEEERLEEERKREEEKIKIAKLMRKEKLNEKFSFEICKTGFEITKNSSITIAVAAHFFYAEILSYISVAKLLFSDNLPLNCETELDFKQTYFEYAKKELMKNSMEAYRYCLIKYVGLSYEKATDRATHIYNTIDYSNMKKELSITYQHAYSEFSIERSNARIKYGNKLSDLSTYYTPIKSVYSNSISGLIKKSISAGIVNQLTAVLVDAKGEIKKTNDEFEGTISKSYALHTLEIIDKIYSYVKPCVQTVYRLLIDEWYSGEFILTDELFELDDDEYENISVFLKDELSLNEIKQTNFLTLISEKPWDFRIWVDALKWVQFDIQSLETLLKMIDYLGLKEIILEYIEGNEQFEDVKKVLLTEWDSLSDHGEFYRDTIIAPRTYKGKLYSTIEEKDEQINYDKDMLDIDVVSEKLHNFSDYFNQNAYDELVNEIKVLEIRTQSGKDRLKSILEMFNIDVASKKMYNFSDYFNQSAYDELVDEIKSLEIRTQSGKDRLKSILEKSRSIILEINNEYNAKYKDVIIPLLGVKDSKTIKYSTLGTIEELTEECKNRLKKSSVSFSDGELVICSIEEPSTYSDVIVTNKGFYINKSYRLYVEDINKVRFSIGHTYQKIDICDAQFKDGRWSPSLFIGSYDKILKERLGLCYNALSSIKAEERRNFLALEQEHGVSIEELSEETIKNKLQYFKEEYKKCFHPDDEEFSYKFRTYLKTLLYDNVSKELYDSIGFDFVKNINASIHNKIDIYKSCGEYKFYAQRFDFLLALTDHKFYIGADKFPLKDMLYIKFYYGKKDENLIVFGTKKSRYFMSYKKRIFLNPADQVLFDMANDILAVLNKDEKNNEISDDSYLCPYCKSDRVKKSFLGWKCLKCERSMEPFLKKREARKTSYIDEDFYKKYELMENRGEFVNEKAWFEWAESIK